MRILLLGEYSNVHWTLAEGLRALGHEVTVVSDGDGWKNYPRDISLHRKSTGKIDTIDFMLRLARTLPKLKGFDIVQLINPVFLELKAERLYSIYQRLRQDNKKVFLGAFGMDYYWVKTGLDGKTFRYSDFNIGNKIRVNKDNERFITEWIKGEKGKLNRYIAKDCDGIVSGLYEYDTCYRPVFPDKTQFIPFPINIKSITPRQRTASERIKFFIGVQRTRNAYKGTDILYDCLMQLAERYPQRLEVVKAENVPYAEYCRMMDGSDVLLDQIYSYTPAMNALLAMAKGIVVVSGGEEENYAILNEKELRPIINVQPNAESVYKELEKIILNPNLLTQLSAESIKYIERHHDHIKVAQQYLEFWNNKTK